MAWKARKGISESISLLAGVAAAILVVGAIVAPSVADVVRQVGSGPPDFNVFLAASGEPVGPGSGLLRVSCIVTVTCSGGASCSNYIISTIYINIIDRETGDLIYRSEVTPRKHIETSTVTIPLDLMLKTSSRDIEVRVLVTILLPSPEGPADTRVYPASATVSIS